MNAAVNSISLSFKKVIGPIHRVYAAAFDANKYVAGFAFAAMITFGLFFVMVILISLGDAKMKDDNSVKLADIVMPEREIQTFMDDVDKPDKPDEQPEDIAQPELDLQPLQGLDVSIAKPKTQIKAGGTFFRDGEYIPLFKVQPIYPRRAQERGTQGFAIVKFTITESGSVENAEALEGYCGDPTLDVSELRPCSIFNSASARAALKLKYKPKIVDGRAVAVPDVLHRFTFIMAGDE